MHVQKPLRCLVIPGNHLLDIRSMWTAVSPLDCYIRYLGFNEGHGSGDIGTDVYVANNAVTSLGGVISNSQVVKDRFESIAGIDSQAYKYLKDYGPYHVVNLDLCDSMFPNTDQNVEPYYTALNRLLEYQFKAQKTSWLLFITTVVVPALVDNETMQNLCAPTRLNFDEHPSFSEEMKILLPHAALKDDTGNVDLAGLSEEQVICLFGVAFGKWLLRMGQSPSPKWTVEMRRSYRYTINEDKGAVMLSLAFEMMPNFAPPVDTTGMSQLNVSVKTFPSEAESAVKLAKSVANITDVIHKLSEDTALNTELRDEAANLMAMAGFDREKYIRWVEAGEQSARI